MSFTTISSISAGPRVYRSSTRPSSLLPARGGDEVVPRNRGPFPKPIQRPTKVPKANIGLGLGLPSDVLPSSFRGPSEVQHHARPPSLEPSATSAVTVAGQPTKAELRSLRVAALRGLGIFLDENPRPPTTNSSTFEPSSPSFSSTRLPSFARIRAERIAKAENDEILNPTFFTHSPLPADNPSAPPSTPACPYEAPPASTLPVPFPRPHAGCADVDGKDVILINNYTSSPFPIDDREDHVVESVASPVSSFVFQPFSPVEEGVYHLPSNLLVSPDVVPRSEYFSFSALYETSVRPRL